MKELFKIIISYGTVIAIAVTSVVVMVTGQTNWPIEFAVILIISYCITGTTGALFIALDRLNLRPMVHYLLLVPGSIIGTVTGVYLAKWILYVLLPGAVFLRGPGELWSFIVLCLTITFVVTIIEHINEARKQKQEELHEEQKKVEELESTSKEAIIQSLRSRLNPHFLFNTLNSISELIHRDPDQAEQAVVNLSEVYRRTLDLSEKDRVTVQEEIELLEKYLENEQMRFGNRLKVSVSVADECRDVEIPALILQPFVENAVTKGIAPRKEGGSICISAARVPEGTLLKVEDQGAGCESFQPGFGIRNVLHRLELIYGDRFDFNFESEHGNGTTVTLMIPDGGQ